MSVEVNFYHLLIVMAIAAAVYGAIGFHFGKGVGKYRSVQQLVRLGYKPPNEAMIWEFLLRALSGSSGVEIARTKDDYERALPGLKKLIAAGYFADNPYELTDSFWMMASVVSKPSEQNAYFERESEGFQVVNEVLNDLFDRSV